MNKSFCLNTHIYYGKGSVANIKKINPKRVCIVTDKYMLEFGLVKKVTDILESENIEYRIFSEVEPDPTLAIVKKGVSHLVENKPDVIIAIGGGSVIDTAKAIIFFDIELQEKILRKEDTKKTYFVAIPTTSGTGSEVTSYSVVTDKENNIKIPLMSSKMFPDIAILDSDFTKTLPQKVIADSGMDVLTHAIEAYVSLQSTPFSKSFATEAITLAVENLIPMYNNLENDDYRLNMLLASCLAGLAFEYSTLGLNHGIAHSIGAQFKLAHGLCNAILLPYIISYNAGLYSKRINDRLLKKYSEVAKLFKIVDKSPIENVMALIEKLKDMNIKMNIPLNFSEAGINRNDYFLSLNTMANNTMGDACTLGNPIDVTLEEVKELYKKLIWKKQCRETDESSVRSRRCDAEQLTLPLKKFGKGGLC